jgi:hypothetical protein
LNFPNAIPLLTTLPSDLLHLRITFLSLNGRIPNTLRRKQWRVTTVTLIRSIDPPRPGYPE